MNRSHDLQSNRVVANQTKNVCQQFDVHVLQIDEIDPQQSLFGVYMELILCDLGTSTIDEWCEEADE